MKKERVVLIDNDEEAQRVFFKALRETHEGHRLEGMAKSEEELMCLLRDGIEPTALVVNRDFEKAAYLAELMRRRSPNIIVEFYSSGKVLPEKAEALEVVLKEAALQNVAKKLVNLHH
ncbi:MAG TPA: hypothetical protein VMR19_04705 [Candidatus Saccharimonadales bacterium]|jgi:hypothetical protein|nr:hypothetical protein [Candidatus Saccharimonadales bacterium]